MYKRILVATHASRRSRKAVKRTIELAVSLRSGMFGLPLLHWLAGSRAATLVLR